MKRDISRSAIPASTVKLASGGTDVGRAFQKSPLLGHRAVCAVERRLRGAEPVAGRSPMPAQPRKGEKEQRRRQPQPRAARNPRAGEDRNRHQKRDRRDPEARDEALRTVEEERPMAARQDLEREKGAVVSLQRFRPSIDEQVPSGPADDRRRDQGFLAGVDRELETLSRVARDPDRRLAVCQRSPAPLPRRLRPRSP